MKISKQKLYIKYFSFFIFALVVLGGCESESVNTPLYEGEFLTIGIIGNAPKVREENIVFKKITFKDIEDDNKLSAEYDGVFIMKENLSEAANSKYAKVYLNSSIPFFFIESSKSYMPFINEKLSYENSPETHSDNYATGILKSGDKIKTWGYGLYNDKVNETNIKDAYTRIFSTIESIKASK